MRVLIAGSTHFEGGKAVQQEFVVACEQLGAALAAANHDLILGSDKETTADAHVFKGFSSVSEHGEILIIRPRDGKSTPFAGYRDDISISYDRQRGNWATIRVYEVLRADIVLIVGGRFGTELVAQTAVALEKPVLAIPCFGGVSKKLFDEFEREYRALPDVVDDVGSIHENWSDEHPRIAMRLLDALARFNPYVRRRTLPLVLTLLATVGMIALWVFLIESPIESSPLANVFSLLAIAVFLGTNLRFGLRQLSSPTKSMHLQLQLTHATVGLAVAFGLTLMFLLGGFSVTGTWDFLNAAGAGELDNKANDLLRVGVILSALGLSAGFLLETASSKLREWLTQFIS